jgi:hypothetical protein
MDELIERLNVSIADHRAHIVGLEAAYGRGTKIDERQAGIALRFGDVIDLADALTTLQAREATLIRERDAWRLRCGEARNTLDRIFGITRKALATSDLAEGEGAP